MLEPTVLQGWGTFGQVIQGQCRSTGEMVAIKILKNCDHDGQIVKNELKLLQALREGDTKDSHISHFLESFSDTVWTYLVFELLQKNLFDFQKQNNFSPLPVRHTRTITAQVLVALVKLKELSIIHADLKPENIMLVDHARYPFHIKLVDFGSAILLPEVCHVQEPYIQTRFYRAPEILLGLPFCEKVDIWSLGCVMAELHLGWPLYPGNDEYDQVCYISSTLGLPQGELLCAAQKTQSFFQREELAKMLTWDSHERITPSAALNHLFIPMQEMKASFEATQYYQLILQGFGEWAPEAGLGCPCSTQHAPPTTETVAVLPPLRPHSNPCIHSSSPKPARDLLLPHPQAPQPPKPRALLVETTVRAATEHTVPDATDYVSQIDPSINSFAKN
uniref:Homeodomain interacting protein kinase 4 n=1 Tax=Taeniopygia guttata TaxID=59729 RepID=A0A674H3V6_TAEGU